MATAAIIATSELLAYSVGQALILKGIKETSSKIYNSIQNIIYLNCPDLIILLENLDLEIKILTIENFLKECNIKIKSKSIDLALHNIYQIITLFKIELNKIHKIILEHKKKYFHKFRTPNYAESTARLKMYSKLLDSRMKTFTNIVKTFSSNCIKFEENDDKITDIYNIDNDYIFIDSEECK